MARVFDAGARARCAGVCRGADGLPQRNSLGHPAQRAAAPVVCLAAAGAHELRTPIAGIRAQAQVALGAGADAAQRQHALQATLAGCDRATRLVEQLLTLARLEAAPATPCAAGERLDLSALARRVAANLAPCLLYTSPSPRDGLLPRM